jgi:hypothetical protein
MKRKLLVVLFLALSAGATAAMDFDGDGTSDIAVFRGSTGLWAIRGVSRLYFGGRGDFPVPSDYDGNGSVNAAIFRSSTGGWAIRDVTRLYFGGDGDVPVAGDYNGDGTADAGVFRATNGLWSIRGVSRIYYGANGDIPAAPPIVSSLARVEYIARSGGMGQLLGVEYVDWTGETKNAADPGYSWSSSFSAQSGTRVYLAVAVPDVPGTHAKLIVNNVSLLDIETQDYAGFDGCLRRNLDGNYYFDGTTWDE